MTNKFKALLGLGFLAIAFILFSSSGTNANNRVFKYRLLHNGHYICVPKPAMEAHLREHVGNFTCEDKGQCSEVDPTAAPPAN